MAVDSSFYKKKSKKGIYFATIFLVLAILGTIALFFYNKTIISENQELESQISQRTDAVDNLRQDKNIEAYYLYNLNQQVLSNFAEKSKISIFVKHAFTIMNTYDLAFDGFDYSDGNITLNALAESNDNGLAYVKVSKLLSEYNVNQRSLFTLHSVESFLGQDNIRFSLKFTVK